MNDPAFRQKLQELGFGSTNSKEETVGEIEDWMKENNKALLGPDHQQFNIIKENRSIPHITNLNEDE